MSHLTPATFYDWLLLIKKHHLKLGPLEGFKDSLVHHALDANNRNISYGFWDHQSGSGYLDPEKPKLQKEEAGEWDVFKK
jgi:hypothetical protein